MNDQQSEQQAPERTGIVGHLKDLLTTASSLLAVNAVQKVANFSAAAVQGILVYFLCSLIILFFSAGCAWWLGDLMKSRAAGFFTVSGFYCLVVLVFVILRKKIIYPAVRNSIIHKIYE